MYIFEHIYIYSYWREATIALFSAYMSDSLCISGTVNKWSLMIVKIKAYVSLYIYIGIELYMTKKYVINEGDWVIDFNCMSTNLDLFYAKRLGNCVHWTAFFS